MLDIFKNVFKGNSTPIKKSGNILKNISVLFIDDDIDFCKNVKMHMEKRVGTLLFANDSNEALEIYNQHKPDIIVCEINIEEMDGIELSKIFKSISKNIPIILISYLNDIKVLKKVIDVKIDKFISKPIKNINIILEAIEKMAFELKNHYLKSDMHCKEIIDPLTKTYNRYKMNELIIFQINKNKRFKTIFSLALLKPDDFKKINETHGYKAGDEIILKLADFIQKNIRSVDILGVWSENIFLIILPQTDENGALKFAENLKNKINNAKFNEDEKITVSIGLSEFKKEDDFASITKRVEEALKRAKTFGLNRISF